MFGSFGPSGSTLSGRNERSSFNSNANRPYGSAPRTPNTPFGTARPQAGGFMETLGFTRPDRSGRAFVSGGGTSHATSAAASAPLGVVGLPSTPGAPAMATSAGPPPAFSGPLPTPSALGFTAQSIFGLPPATAFPTPRPGGGGQPGPQQSKRLTGSRMQPPPRRDPRPALVNRARPGDARTPGVKNSRGL